MLGLNSNKGTTRMMKRLKNRFKISQKLNGFSRENKTVSVALQVGKAETQE
jgi:hypothetical protein